MKLFLLLGLTLLTAFAVARVVPEALSNLIYARDLNITVAGDIPPFDEYDPATAAGNDDDDQWVKSVERGTKLLAGMKGSDQEAATLYGLGDSAESPFDGDLKDKLREWGYNDNIEAMQKREDPWCNFDSVPGQGGHSLKPTFTDLQLDTTPKGKGGPNECFQIEHYDSPAVERDENGDLPGKQNQYYKVCGKDYRITDAEHTIGVNAAGGAVFAIGISSAASSARRLWRRVALPEELPAIRSVSDIAWAFWNRAHQDTTTTSNSNIQDIKYFFVTMIINPETNRHIRRALSSLSPPKDTADGWPGTEFDMQSEAGKALLGSPVGRWAGYFLMQHKRQLGGSKVISKVRVFKSEKAGSLPYLLFYVEDGGGPGETPGLGVWEGPWWDGVNGTREEGGSAVKESRVVERSEDGKNVVREHVLRGRL
ncbi:Mitochondrial import inner membrane translocase subunit tim8 [Neocucurbitaria cava]|uniref:Mitochondrial import inner membrane translocase subunit tim8 n=1 Tax=Neocucurbitaria cava TaxID=798079 RepID=A0A9W8Y4S4_9PLEO|nr:Mitochondrial import inner membrane translocase subunit tim8 [Neocucurbitaria cava]